ncbi:hypothetical protein ONE63_008984 [Megalurothrips usitatus]|uniref:PA domain-containing protein n=1 Tax=Megalurothrips usitatus TaxID=439358 RepID=A0AAV7XPW6_9NEOP|nr:hypothetical protein ONE63_008984 [Megalurothrips usitatus]
MWRIKWVDNLQWLAWLLLVSHFVLLVNSVASNLHLMEGTSIPEILGSDVFFEIIDPRELGYTYRLRPAKDFGAPFNDSFQAVGVGLVPVDPPSGCGWPQNADSVEGNIALVERGECSFVSKALKMEEVGALAVIVADNDIRGDEHFIDMVDDNTLREVHIPAGFLLGKNGHMIRRTLEKLRRKRAVVNIPVNLTYVPLVKHKQPPWLGW